jgi:hypothetical protein
MTTLTLRYRKGYFVVSGPDTQPTRFRSRREAKDWEKRKTGAIHGIPGSPIHEIGTENQHDR